MITFFLSLSSPPPTFPQASWELFDTSVPLIYTSGLQPFPADPHFQLIFAHTWKQLRSVKLRYPPKDTKFSIFGNSLGVEGLSWTAGLRSPYVLSGMLFRCIYLQKTNTDWPCVYQTRDTYRVSQVAEKLPGCWGCAHTCTCMTDSPPYSMFSSSSSPATACLNWGIWTLVFTLRAGTEPCLSMTGWDTGGYSS